MYMLIERGLDDHFRSECRYNPSRAEIALIKNCDSTQLSGPMLSGASHAIIPIRLIQWQLAMPSCIPMLWTTRQHHTPVMILLHLHLQMAPTKNKS